MEVRFDREAEPKAKRLEKLKIPLDVLNKPLEATFVVIEEVDMENWGWGGLPVQEYRKQKALKSGESGKTD